MIAAEAQSHAMPPCQAADAFADLFAAFEERRRRGRAKIEALHIYRAADATSLAFHYETIVEPGRFTLIAAFGIFRGRSQPLAALPESLLHYMMHYSFHY